MPTGIGSRKVLTPRSVKVPRRSLPPQSKLLEAVSFESISDDNFDQLPSSPDIMTTKLQEKIKNNKAKEKLKATNNNVNNSFNQRLNAAASLTANSGRSKLSTEEFRAEEAEEELIVNDRQREREKQKDSRVIHEARVAREARNFDLNNNNNNNINSNSRDSNNNGYKSSYSAYSNNNSNNNNNSTTDKNYNVPYVQSTSNNSYNNSYNKSSSSNSNSSSYNSNYLNTMPLNNNIPNNSNSNSNNYLNNSFDRWNSTLTSTPNDSMVSIELLQDQVTHLKKEYEGLKQRFTELSRLRLSDPEEHLSEHLKLCEIRDRAGEKSILALKKENEELKRQLKERALSMVDNVNVDNVVDNVECEEEDEEEELSHNHNQDQNNDNSLMLQVEKILKIYSNFTGLKITPTPTHWHCEFSTSSRRRGGSEGKSKNTKFDFKLIYEKELNRYQYLPILDNQDQEKVQLPPFLASDILITSDQMQIFFWRLLDTLNKQE